MKAIELLVNQYDQDQSSLAPKVIRLLAILTLQTAFLILLWWLPDTVIKNWMGDRIFANWAMVYCVLLIFYYGSESFSLTFGSGFFMMAMLFLTQQIYVRFISDQFIMIGLGCFVLAIVLFVIGRLISGSLKNIGNDILFIPIQPVWILSYLYRWMGLSI